MVEKGPKAGPSSLQGHPHAAASRGREPYWGEALSKTEIFHCMVLKVRTG